MTTTEDILNKLRERFTVNQESMQIMFNYRSESDTREIVVATISDIEHFVKEALDTAYLAGGYDLRTKLMYDFPILSHGACERIHEDSIEEAYNLFYDELKANKSLSTPEEQLSTKLSDKPEEKKCLCFCHHEQPSFPRNFLCEHCKLEHIPTKFCSEHGNSLPCHYKKA